MAYKLRLGSPKDLEDALHLIQTVGGILKEDVVQTWAAKLGVPPNTLEKVWP